MKYITTKWSDLTYKSGCSDVIWITRILLRKMEYNFSRWSVLEDFPLYNPFYLIIIYFV